MRVIFIVSRNFCGAAVLALACSISVSASAKTCNVQCQLTALQKKVDDLQAQVTIDADTVKALQEKVRSLPNAGLLNHVVLKSTNNPTLCLVQQTPGTGVAMATCQNSSLEKFDMVQ